jgi:hypothetical protein
MFLNCALAWEVSRTFLLVYIPVIESGVSQPPVRGPQPIRGKFLPVRKTFTTKGLFFLKTVEKR